MSINPKTNNFLAFLSAKMIFLLLFASALIAFLLYFAYGDNLAEEDLKQNRVMIENTLSQVENKNEVIQKKQGKILLTNKYIKNHQDKLLDFVMDAVNLKNEDLKFLEWQNKKNFKHLKVYIPYKTEWQNLQKNYYLEIYEYKNGSLFFGPLIQMKNGCIRRQFQIDFINVKSKVDIMNELFSNELVVEDSIKWEDYANQNIVKYILNDDCGQVYVIRLLGLDNDFLFYDYSVNNNWDNLEILLSKIKY